MAYNDRLINVMKGMPASGGYTGPQSLGSPSDRAPALPKPINPQVPFGRRVSAQLKKKKPTSAMA